MRAAWWWIDRWRKSTAYTDMTAEQQGVYRNLLDELWLRDGILPLSEKALSQISGDSEAWPRARAVVLSRFERTDAGYRHQTHDEVSSQSRGFRDAQADAGRARAANAKRDALGRLQPAGPAGKPSQDQPDSQPPAQPASQPPSPSPSPNSDSDSDSSSLRSEERAADAAPGGNPTLPGMDPGPPKAKRKCEPTQDQVDLLVVKPIWLDSWQTQHGKPYGGLEGSGRLPGRRRSALRNVFRKLDRNEAEFRQHCARYLAAPLFKDRKNPDPIAMLESFDSVHAGLNGTSADAPGPRSLARTAPRHSRRPDGTRDGEYSEPVQFPRVFRYGESGAAAPGCDSEAPGTLEGGGASASPSGAA
jgi:uncharacterized protein YdaU (DUF1376 family)